MVGLTVNGHMVEAPEGATLLQALRAQGIQVPTACHDDRLAPVSLCRLCEVEVDGQARNPCACATVVEPGMVVRTHTPDLEAYREEMLSLLAERHPQNPKVRTPFRAQLDTYGVPVSAAPERQPNTSHPTLALDPAACIDCRRCVRMCDEVQGQRAWGVLDRGGRVHVELDPALCVSCGACADTCPTTAIQGRLFLGEPEAEAWTRTTCPYCGTGCQMEVGVADDRIVAVRPVLDSPVNRGHLCVKGRYGHAFVDAGDRITAPMVRRKGRWVEVSWDEALDEAAHALSTIKETHGPKALGVLGSARATNEENFLIQKLARVALGTNNVDCCARVCHGPSAAGLGQIFGTGAATNGFDDIEQAGLILVVGANPTENHPILGARLKQRARTGVPLIVIDPRRTELAALADVHLAPRPGTNLPLLQALAQVICEEGLTDAAFLEARTEGFEAFRAHVAPWTPERAGALCGLDPELIRRAARLYATTSPAYMCHGLGVTEHLQGTDGVIALAHLAMLTGNLGKPDAGVNPYRGQNNVQGSAQMGCEPNRLTGYQKAEVAQARHEAVWGVTLPDGPGLDLLQMLDAAAEGSLKGLLVFGYDVYLSTANAHATAAALANLESLVVVDLFLTETARAYGTVFLPAASSFEKEGTFMNGERRIQRVHPAVTPRGQAWSDQAIVQALAARLGWGAAFAHGSASDVWDEVRSLWPHVAGMPYGRLEGDGLRWPCPAEDHPGSGVLHKDSFPVGTKATFRLLGYRPTAETTDADFPFVLTTGRSLYHFNAATMTDRTPCADCLPADLLQIHPEDAVRLGLAEGARVTVESRHGSFPAQATVTDAVRPGELFSTFHDIAAFVNRATGPGRDAVTHTPEYKVTAVRVFPPSCPGDPAQI